MLTSLLRTKTIIKILRQTKQKDVHQMLQQLLLKRTCMKLYNRRPMVESSETYWKEP